MRLAGISTQALKVSRLPSRPPSRYLQQPSCESAERITNKIRLALSAARKTFSFAIENMTTLEAIRRKVRIGSSVSLSPTHLHLNAVSASLAWTATIWKQPECRVRSSSPDRSRARCASKPARGVASRETVRLAGYPAHAAARTELVYLPQ